MTEPHILAAVINVFGLHGELLSAGRYGSGHIHDTWCVTFDREARIERFILQRINTTIFTNPVPLMQNIERVTAHLRFKSNKDPDADRRVLYLLHAEDGRSWYVDAEGRYWRAYRFIEGAHTFDSVSSPAQAYAAARAFGDFQRLLSDLPAPPLHESLPNFHNTAKRYQAFQKAIDDDAAGRSKEARQEIAFAIARRATATALLDAGLPQRVTHNDTKLNNVLLDDTTGEGVCVIDLDTVMPGLVAYDFGDMIRTMTCPAAEDERDLSRVTLQFPLFEAVLRGYLAGASGFLTADEREHLITGARVIVFEQGIRFLADYLAGDTYYKVQRPGQNLDRCRTQFKLLESIEQHEQAMAHLLRTLP
jgi:Ser/Thr protein kinase RdoA (MazF antagonist)